MQDPQPDFQPKTGIAQELEPGLRRVLAPNPSPMTYKGTNTYLLGTKELAVIDPGPDDSAHLHAILDAVNPGQSISHILVTHAHLDHSPLSRALAAETGAPILAFGDHTAGRSDVMEALAQTGLAGGGEGVDGAFVPDQIVGHGDRVEGFDWEIQALHTPGHFGNHMAFAWNDAVFVGDLVMGWASSLVSPPDGDLTDFMASCASLQQDDWRVFHSGHGAPIDTPAARLDWLISHRKGREHEILTHLQDGPFTAVGLAERIYRDTPSALLPAAARNVFAHLVDLHQRDLIEAHDGLSHAATFRHRRVKKS